MNTMTQSPFNRTVFDIDSLGKRLLDHARNGGDPVAMNYSISRSDHCRLQAYDGDWIIPETAERQMLDFDSLEWHLKSLMRDEPTWHVRISTHQHGVRLDPLIPMHIEDLIRIEIAKLQFGQDQRYACGYSCRGDAENDPSLKIGWSNVHVKSTAALISMLQTYRPSALRLYLTAGGQVMAEMR